MENKAYTILTGATSGIGYETVKKLALAGHNLILGNRNQEKAEIVKEELVSLNKDISVRILPLDQSSFRSIEEFAEKIRNEYGNIACLVNNAGLFMRFEAKTKEGFEMSMGVNYIGTMYLTELLLDTLKRSNSPRIVMVSSLGCYYGMLKMNENAFSKFSFSFTNYFNSKLACLLYTRDLADREKGILVKAADPGIFYSQIFKWRSGFGRFLEKIQRRIMRNSEHGSRIIYKLATINGLDIQSGLLYSQKRVKSIPKRLKDKKFCDEYLEYTRKLIKDKGGRL